MVQKIAIQLNHAGASALEERIGMQPVSAGNLPNKKGGKAPRPLKTEEIYEIVKNMESLQNVHKSSDLMLLKFTQDILI